MQQLPAEAGELMNFQLRAEAQVSHLEEVRWADLVEVPEEVPEGVPVAVLLAGHKAKEHTGSRELMTGVVPRMSQPEEGAMQAREGEQTLPEVETQAAGPMASAHIYWPAAAQHGERCMGTWKGEREALETESLQLGAEAERTGWQRRRMAEAEPGIPEEDQQEGTGLEEEQDP